MTAPRLTVIIPVHQGEQVLPRALAALQASDLPRADWELVIVDDGSRDQTGAIARAAADRVVMLPAPPRGPAFARNRGVEVARGEVVMFVDADVCVHPDALRLAVEALAATPAAVAVFGAYDTAPARPDFLSQYRNLLHHYVHSISEGDADSFWAGCGAVRRAAFVAVGGFDERRYPRPEIEDIELGYRLRRAGGRILLRPAIQGTHLKRWDLAGMLRTDVFQRGVPWMRLLLEGAPPPGGHGLNTGAAEKVKTGAVGIAGLLLLAAVAMRDPRPALAAAALVLLVVASNWRLVAWFARTRGAIFALRVIPFNILFYVVTTLSASIAIVRHLSAGTEGEPRASSVSRS